MRKPPQLRWAVVGSRGYIHHHTARFGRKQVIADIIADHRAFTSPRHNGAGLTDAQFWRRLKRMRNWSVKRISLRVVS